ncbi:hypothetical protein IC229_32025 [Spirosoma sp. BT702]|uniref:Uncharacterized protein n=1 Tax=Spirosoma profusum TaxID=2771354 RepID=A0A927AVN9_9BACT|nr:hypothetical protein [Spirosoma profusum]MBD2705290.1 hypothetical protein [Spirosoma profusum]
MVTSRLFITGKMIERMLQIFENMNLSLGDVARASGVAYDTLNQIKIGRVKAMRTDTLGAIIKAYPEINANYILTGIGSSKISTDTPNITDDVRIAYEAIGRVKNALG